MPSANTTPPEKRRRSTPPQTVLANARRAAAHIKVGRPLSYNLELCERAIALGMIGKSWAGIAREFGLSRDTINEWVGLYPEFSDAMRRARAAAQAWWEDHGQKNLKAKHYQAQVSRTIMGAMFEDYRENRSTAGLEALPDFLAAIAEAADRRKLAKAQPGDDAKPIDLLPMVPDEPKG